MRKRYLVALVLAAQVSAELREGAILKLTIQDPVTTKMAPGTIVNAELAAPAFDGFGEVLPSGTKLKLTATRVWKERTVGRKRNIVERIFRPLDFAPRVTRMEIQQAALPSGQAFPASALRMSRGVTWLRVDSEVSLASTAVVPQSKTVTLPAGTRLNAVLVTAVHSGLSRNDDGLRAVLRQPLFVDGQAVLSAGSELDGKVVNVKPSRWLHRAGHVRLNFQHIAAPGQPTVDITAAISALDPAEKNPWRVDSEGVVSGGPQSKVKMLLQIGISYATGKIIDDLMEEGIKAAAGAAAAGTAATAARYTSLAVGATLFAIQRGRDAELKRYTEIEITLSRPATIAVTSTR